MSIIDTHTHLFLPHFDKDRDEVIRRALDSGVDRMMLPNIDADSVKPLTDMVNKYPEYCFPAMGIHPNSIKEDYKKQMETIEKQFQNGKYYAIGETGIDLYWDKTYQKEQTDAFMMHIEWAKKFNLPLIIHSRNAVEPLLEILSQKQYKDIPGVFHCYTGSIEHAKKITGLGFKIGVGGIVTFKNAGIDRMVAQLTMDDILPETDAPYLAPVPHRGKRNESAYTIHVVEKIAELFNITAEEVAEITNRNAKQLFGGTRHDLELMAFEVGLKPALRRAAADADHAKELVARLRLSGHAACVSRQELTLGAARCYTVYAAKTEAEAQRLRNLDESASPDTQGPKTRTLTNRELGRALGYPSCCVESFIARELHPRPLLMRALTRTPHYRHRAARDAWTDDARWELNPHLLGEGFALISFEPCSYGCRHALTIARAAFDLLRGRDANAAARMKERLSGVIAIGWRGSITALRYGPDGRVASAQPLRELFDHAPDAISRRQAARLLREGKTPRPPNTQSRRECILIDYGG